jgi:hypothetical protein
MNIHHYASLNTEPLIHTSVRSTSRPLYAGEVDVGTHLLGGWVGAGAGLNAVENKKSLDTAKYRTTPSSV